MPPCKPWRLHPRAFPGTVGSGYKGQRVNAPEAALNRLEMGAGERAQLHSILTRTALESLHTVTQRVPVGWALCPQLSPSHSSSPPRAPEFTSHRNYHTQTPCPSLSVSGGTHPSHPPVPHQNCQFFMQSVEKWPLEKEAPGGMRGIRQGESTTVLTLHPSHVEANPSTQERRWLLPCTGDGDSLRCPW